jgi:hypothetical protein
MNLILRGFLIASAALVALSLLPAPASAQPQEDSSVADAARRSREQKKNAPKAVRTLTNDNLPAATAAESKPAAAPSDQTASDRSQPAPDAPAVADKKPTEALAEQEKRAQKKAEVEASLKQAKADLAQCEGQLSVLERKQALDSNSYYSKTDYRQDTAGKAALDADAQEISDKKSQVEALKTKIAGLQAEIEQYSEPEKTAPQQPQ